ncbi:flagellar hook-length control protein FliK [Schinkia azotoformans]|uniref:Flagellar hook-length control protein n=1 Tax=Schinkia azotoformans LMG 9581 TaxID=1131731 RepID=K6DSX8_SCHAZ|nr:flagellar hook-length control protein FliK [Schinkia azotoformans]EKN63886.1 flagellar hook-length control protein [Schinkia azotoformans LMG 9581]MEC1638250.1 flagellar hook-length control protein FliK [Schinkia azotoformans]MEC1946316.1 flagellar hook-length control protein FliK [Schinkia azotoformans]
MNAAAVFVNPKATQKVDIPKKSMDTVKNGGNETNPFAKLLSGEVNKNEYVTVPKGKEDSQPLLVKAEVAADNSVDSEELLQAMEQLQELIPIDQGFIDPKLIEDPEVLALLNQMPPQIQQLLKDFIQSGQSFEYLVAQTETGSQEQIGLLLLSLYQLEKKGQLPDDLKQPEFMKLLQRQINEEFNVQIPEKEVQSASMLLSKLNELLNKKNTTNPVDTVMQNKFELRQAIQRVLYSTSANENAGQQDTAKKESSGTTNNVTEVKMTQSVVHEDVFDQLVASSIKDGGSVNRIQQYALNVGQTSGSPLPEDQILEQLQTIMKQSKFSTSPNGTNQLMLKLNPAHLGTLTIKLIESNGEMIARIIASSKTAKEVIETNLNSLRHVFTTQNITVEKLDIQYQGDSQFDESNKGNRQQEDQSKRNEQEPANQRNKDEDSIDSNSFKDELLNIMV